MSVSTKAEPRRFVLDSFALLAHFEDERDGPVVRGLLEQALRGEAMVHMSVINLGEVVYITERERGLPMAERLIAAVDSLPIQIFDADRRLTLAAAHLKARFRVSYAGAFALALAVETRSALVTGDPEFRAVGELVPFVWLQR